MFERNKTGWKCLPNIVCSKNNSVGIRIDRLIQFSSTLQFSFECFGYNSDNCLRTSKALAGCGPIVESWHMSSNSPVVPRLTRVLQSMPSVDTAQWCRLVATPTTRHWKPSAGDRCISSLTKAWATAPKPRSTRSKAYRSVIRGGEYPVVTKVNICRVFDSWSGRKEIFLLDSQVLFSGDGS